MKDISQFPPDQFTHIKQEPVDESSCLMEVESSINRQHNNNHYNDIIKQEVFTDNVANVIKTELVANVHNKYHTLSDDSQTLEKCTLAVKSESLLNYNKVTQ